MADRPVFLPTRTVPPFVKECSVAFHWFAGLSLSQKQKSIASLHSAAKEQCGAGRILEISTKSPDPLGVRLSAFNLTLPADTRRVPVEVAFQASKVFEHGGPFLDLLNVSPRAAKSDSRLSKSGRLLEFQFAGQPWPTEPRTAFYDWLYLHALSGTQDLAAQLATYDAFTDIEFNPSRSLNCQARSAALYVSLERQSLLHEALSSKAMYLQIISQGASGTAQPSLF